MSYRDQHTPKPQENPPPPNSSTIMTNTIPYFSVSGKVGKIIIIRKNKTKFIMKAQHLQRTFPNAVFRISNLILG